MRAMLAIFSLALALPLLAGCGQMGPLYMPREEPPAPSAQPQPATVPPAPSATAPGATAPGATAPGAS